MAALCALGKAGLLALVIVTTLSLQGAEAQNDTCIGDPPRWGIAVIALLVITLCLWLICCCLVPLCTGLCKRGGDGCQSGCSFGK